MRGLFDPETLEVEGVVTSVVYRPLTGDFAVLRVRRDDGEGLTATGPLGDATVGERVRLAGRYEDHPTYGRQFRATAMEKRAPTTEEGLLAFLEGARFRGIGPKTAGKLVAAFGTDLLTLGRDPQALVERAGLSRKKAEEIARQIRGVEEEAETELLFLSAGLRGAVLHRVRRVLGEGAIAMIRENPYLLAEKIDGVGFKRADAVAGRLGIDPASPARTRAAVLYALREASGEGHVFQTAGDLAERLTALDVPQVGAADAVRAIAATGEAATDGERVYLTALFGAESRSARRVARRLRMKPFARALPPGVAASLAEGQADAVALALTAPLAILTGGPGTGKTTAVRGLVEAATRLGLRLALAAPSGRAARRLVEATGHPAQTLHRLLRLRPPTFQAQPVDADLVVVDESSMLDIQLFDALMGAVPDGCGILLVGDADQLPPVGAGSPFLDLVASGLVPAVRLTEIYRQEEGSRLAENAHLIGLGNFPRDGGTDFVWHRVGDVDEAHRLAVALALEESRRFGIDEVEVLSAGNRSATGTGELNRALQEALNATPDVVRIGSLAVKPGDKVLQRKNDYALGVYNGEVGRVVGAAPGELTVRFPSPDGEVDVTYDEDAADNLSLGYALTVHKAQGSEFPIVIAVLSTQHYPLLRRNLLYTAVTRAKARLHLIASPRAVAVALRNQGDQERRAALVERIRAHLEAGGDGARG